MLLSYTSTYLNVYKVWLMSSLHLPFVSRINPAIRRDQIILILTLISKTLIVKIKYLVNAYKFYTSFDKPTAYIPGYIGYIT